MGTSPGLWSWVCPVVEKSNIETVVTEILPSKRFQSVKRIELKVVSEEIFGCQIYRSRRIVRLILHNN